MKLSVCTTIHGSPKSFEAFLRSIDENTSAGHDFEVVVCLDRIDETIWDFLHDFMDDFREFNLNIPELIIFEHDGFLQSKWQSGLPPFWATLYGEDIAKHAIGQLARFQIKEIDLWMQYATGLNAAVEKSSGDLILLTPADYFVLFDMHEAANRCWERYQKDGGFFAHLSLVAPFAEMATNDHKEFGDLFTEDFGISAFVEPQYWAILKHLMKYHATRIDYPVLAPFDRFWPHNHGIRIVDRKTFDKVGGLSDYFLTKSGPTDIFNRIARNLVSTHKKGLAYPKIKDFIGMEARMASVPLDEPQLEYLYPNPMNQDVVRDMFYKEEAYFKKEHPEWAGFWNV